jgi:hypothetical protein
VEIIEEVALRANDNGFDHYKIDSETPFGVSYDHIIMWKQFDVDKSKTISDFLQTKREYILSLPAVPLVGKDNPEQMKEDTTNRWLSYNVFQWEDECPEIGELKQFFMRMHLDYLRVSRVTPPSNEYYFQSWVNQYKRGEKIGIHAHNDTPSAYLSANIILDCDEPARSKTSYYPYGLGSDGLIYEARPGRAIMFHSKISHESHVYDGEYRVTVPLDIYLPNHRSEGTYIKVEY